MSLLPKEVIDSIRSMSTVTGEFMEQLKGVVEELRAVRALLEYNNELTVDTNEHLRVQAEGRKAGNGKRVAANV